MIARVNQLEAGLKYQSGGLGLYATGFYAETAETNVDIAPVVLFDTEFEAFGIELEGAYRAGPFALSAGATWTDAEIVDALDASVIGNRPRRRLISSIRRPRNMMRTCSRWAPMWLVPPTASRRM